MWKAARARPVVCGAAWVTAWSATESMLWLAVVLVSVGIGGPHCIPIVHWRSESMLRLVVVLVSVGRGGPHCIPIVHWRSEGMSSKGPCKLLLAVQNPVHVQGRHWAQLSNDLCKTCLQTGEDEVDALELVVFLRPNHCCSRCLFPFPSSVLVACVCVGVWRASR